MKNGEERQEKEGNLKSRKIPGASIKKAQKFANQTKKPKISVELFFLVNFVIFRGLNFVNDAIVSTRKIREN